MSEYLKTCQNCKGKGVVYGSTCQCTNPINKTKAKNYMNVGGDYNCGHGRFKK